MNFNLITNIIIVICIIVVIIVYLIINNTKDITVNNDIKYNEENQNGDIVVKIRDECILECDNQGPFQIRNPIRTEREEGETLEKIYTFLEDGETEVTNYYKPNIIIEYNEEEVTTYTLPPCQHFLHNASILTRV